MHVLLMLRVLTLKETTRVPVTLGSVEMDSFAAVSQPRLRLCISACAT